MKIGPHAHGEGDLRKKICLAIPPIPEQVEIDLDRPTRRLVEVGPKPSLEGHRGSAPQCRESRHSRLVQQADPIDDGAAGRPARSFGSYRLEVLPPSLIQAGRSDPAVRDCHTRPIFGQNGALLEKETSNTRIGGTSVAKSLTRREFRPTMGQDMEARVPPPSGQVQEFPPMQQIPHRYTAGENPGRAVF